MATRAITRPIGFPLFEDFFKPFDEWFETNRFFGKTLKVPPVNVIEDENNYVLSFAVPGMKKEDFEIALEGNMLRVSADRGEATPETEKITRKEYDFYSFSRSFTLPEDVKAEMIEAKYDAGLLMVILPRKEEVKQTSASRQIEVQ